MEKVADSQHLDEGTDARCSRPRCRAPLPAGSPFKRCASCRAKNAAQSRESRRNATPAQKRARRRKAAQWRAKNPGTVAAIKARDYVKERDQALEHYAGGNVRCMQTGCDVTDRPRLRLHHTGGRGAGAAERRCLGKGVTYFRNLRRAGYPPGKIVICDDHHDAFHALDYLAAVSRGPSAVVSRPAEGSPLLVVRQPEPSGPPRGTRQPAAVPAPETSAPARACARGDTSEAPPRDTTTCDHDEAERDTTAEVARDTTAPLPVPTAAGGPDDEPALFEEDDVDNRLARLLELDPDIPTVLAAARGQVAARPARAMRSAPEWREADRDVRMAPIPEHVARLKTMQRSLANGHDTDTAEDDVGDAVEPRPGGYSSGAGATDMQAVVEGAARVQELACRPPDVQVSLDDGRRCTRVAPDVYVLEDNGARYMIDHGQVIIGDPRTQAVASPAIVVPDRPADWDPRDQELDVEDDDDVADRALYD